MERKVAYTEVPYEGFDKQVVFHYSTRKQEKACNVVVKKH